MTSTSDFFLKLPVKTICKVVYMFLVEASGSVWLNSHLCQPIVEVSDGHLLPDGFLTEQGSSVIDGGDIFFHQSCRQGNVPSDCQILGKDMFHDIVIGGTLGTLCDNHLYQA